MNGEVDPYRLTVAGLHPDGEADLEGAFAVANGLAGTRGALEEGGPHSRPATLLAGVFAPRRDTAQPPRAPAAAPAIVAAPDWTALRIDVDGQPLTLEAGTPLTHRRTLDLRDGTLERRWRHRLPSGRTVLLTTRRWALLGPGCGFLQRVTLRLAPGPETACARVRFTAPLPLGHRATLRYAEGDPDGTYVVEQQTGGDRDGVAVAVAQRATLIGAAPDPVDPASFMWTAQPETTYRFDRIAACSASPWSTRPADDARTLLDRLARRGPDALLAEHRDRWADRWRGADIHIDGDPETDRAVRFHLYHLLGTAPPPGCPVPVGARDLSGWAYHGHVMWDADVFVLPFFAFTDPPVARRMLAARHHQLPSARAEAARLGYRGALYPWQTTTTGHEATPLRAKGGRGSLVPMVTGERAHHISADVAWACDRYAQISGDDEFRLGDGAEIICETARFWASRAVPGADGRRHIRGVVGPDEYHEKVDDDAFTNEMARWNLVTAAALADRLRSERPELSARLGLRADEVDRWRAAAAQLAGGPDPATRWIEEFAGYRALDDIDFAAVTATGRPVQPVLGRERTAGTAVVKQASVLQLLHMQPDRYDDHDRRINLAYYVPRTDPLGSTLTPGCHAAVAARAGDQPLAWHWLDRAARIDLDRRVAGAADGVHIAACGGLWQALVLGYAGLRVHPDRIVLDPTLPARWTALTVPLVVRGSHLRVRIDPAAVVADLLDGPPLTVQVAGVARALSAGSRRATWQRGGPSWRTTWQRHGAR